METVVYDETPLAEYLRGAVASGLNGLPSLPCERPC